MAGSINRDIVVAGGGVAGLALALSLKQAGGGRIAVAVHDPAFGRAPHTDLRAYAIASGARRMLTTLGVWDAVEPTAQPILAMDITDSRSDSPVRPLLLGFDGEITPGEPFAHMVENGVLTEVLTAAARKTGVTLDSRPISGFEATSDGVEARTPDGASTRARLLVAADGARSRLREQAGIPFHGWSYSQSAIVGTISHEHDHEGRAVEHFLPAGPFALLPLSAGRRSSIVWTERTADVPRLLARDAADQAALIERHFGLTLGAIDIEGRLQAFPLSFGLARDFVSDRLALLGDAAHVIHPIAGQGLNLGLKDAAALAEAVVDQLRLGLDPGAPEALDAYQRARRFDTAEMAVTTDILNRLFSNDLAPIRAVRDFGLGVVDRMPALKDFFIGRAAGIGARMPRLMRGEAL
jgi:2-octaprenyl-6-methoxyphenol hydroxylase